jgi:hypothetical protein
MQLGAFDDLDDPAAGSVGGERYARSLITCIGKDFQNEGPERARAGVEHPSRAVAILNVGGVNRNAQQEAKRVDKDVSLAPCDLLCPVVALRIDLRPPFGAAFTLWLSMMAAVGLDSRPSWSRTAT